VKQINRSITQAILEHQPEAASRNGVHVNGISARSGPVEECAFVINGFLESHIGRVNELFRMAHTPAEFSHFQLSHLGSRFLRRHGVPPKAGYQLTIQLASRLYYGQQHPSWEVLTLMPFHKGRLDWMQVVSPAMAEFCQAAMDETVSPSVCRPLLRRAATTHASTVTRISRGKGFAAHLEALREVVRDGEPVPALFTDPTWEKMRVLSTRKIKTDSSEGMLALEAGFLMPNPESVLVHYEVQEDGGVLFVQGTAGRTAAFCDALTKAANRVQTILEAQEHHP
jgi:hypothetical protein